MKYWVTYKGPSSGWVYWNCCGSCVTRAELGKVIGTVAQSAFLSEHF